MTKLKIPVTRITIPDGLEYSRSSYPHEGLFVFKAKATAQGFSCLAVVTEQVCTLVVPDAFLDSVIEEHEEGTPGQLTPFTPMVTEGTLLKTIALLTNHRAEEVKF